MFCPECKYEYEPQISKCPDCGVYLVSSLPPDPDSADSVAENNYKWVQLARFNAEITAQMVLEAVRDQDIPAVIHSGTGHFGMTGQMGVSSFRPVGGGYSLLVPDEFIHQADEIAAVIVGDEWPEYRMIDIN